MNTRTLLAGFFVVALVGSAVVGTGAGDIFSDQDGVEESVTLSPADTPEGDAYASTTDAGELSVTIDGLPRNAQTDVDDVFSVSFDSPTSPTANVLIEESESNDNVDFVVTDASNAAGVQSGADIDDSRVELESGESVLVGVELDGTSEGSVEISEITADVELDAGDIDEVDVTFDNNVIAEDDGETQATATAVFQDGPTQDRTDQATFESNDTDVAEVTDGGAIAAGETGTAEITATLPEENGDGTVTGSAVINVGLITDLDVELADDRVRFGSGVNPTETTSVDSVTATLADGSTTDVTSDVDLTVTPATDDADLVDVNDDLTIAPTEEATGTATIRAELQGETATDDVTVSRVVQKTVQDNSVSFSESETDRIRGIDLESERSFDGENVEVEESDRPDPDVEEAIEREIVDPDPTAADFVSAATAEITDDPVDDQFNENDDETATITLTSPIEEVVDPDNPIVIRVPNSGDPVELPDEDVTVTEETEETITVEAETPGFSTFVLGGTTAPDDDGTPVPGDGTPATDDDATETPEPEATETPEPEGQPGFGAGLALVALLAAALLAARRQADG